MEMPRPNEAHRKLERLAGNWTGQEKIYPSPWDPNGGTATARITNRLALDGFAIVQDYEQERRGKVTFRGHGVVCWDSMQKCYVFHWFDSMGMPPNQFKGIFEGNIFSLTCVDKQGHSRSVMEFTDASHYRWKMEMSPDGKQWIPFMEGQYERQG